MWWIGYQRTKREVYTSISESDSSAASLGELMTGTAEEGDCLSDGSEDGVSWLASGWCWRAPADSVGDDSDEGEVDRRSLECNGC